MIRFAAIFLACTATFATAAAQQNGDSYVEFLPMPKQFPTMLFARNSLAGSLLQPFAEPAPSAAAEVAIVPAAAVSPPPAEQASAEELQPLAEPEPISDPDVMTPPEPETANAVASSEPTTADTALAPPVPATAETAVVSPELVSTLPVPEEPAPPVLIQPVNGKVTVIVENVESAAGSVNVAVCDKDLSREGCPYVREVPASLGFVETEFDDIPPGTYAVVGYHDVNGNDEFDKLLGMPREPYALSNNASEKLIPTFRDASLTINAGDNAIIIRLKRLGG